MSAVTLSTDEHVEPGQGRRPARLGGLGMTLTRLLALAVLLACWEVAARTGMIDEFFTSSPTGVAERFGSWASDGSFTEDATATLLVVFIGWSIAAVIGTVLGFMVAASRLLDDVLGPFISALLAVPRIALAPLFILWLGIGYNSKIGLILMENIVIGLIAAAGAAKGIDASQRDLARSLGAGSLRTGWFLVLPGSLPGVFAGLRLGLAYAFAGAILAELLASEKGLGNFLARSAGGLDTAGVLAAVFVVVVLAFLGNLVLSAIERHLLRWRQDAPTESMVTP